MVKKSKNLCKTQCKTYDSLACAVSRCTLELSAELSAEGPESVGPVGPESVGPVGPVGPDFAEIEKRTEADIEFISSYPSAQFAD